jgi:uncharacterized repeat protein (TIGR01451 family)
MQPGGGGLLPISYHNYGNAPESDTLTLVMDSLLSYVSCAVPPTVISGQTLKWAYNNLAPGASAGFLLHLGCDSNAVLGNYTNSLLKIEPFATDLDTSNNTVHLHQLLSASFDPNDKFVSPQGNIPSGTLLNYNIHFQNTGNAAATTVILRDTLDSDLDPMSFMLTASSHPVKFSMTGNGIVNFYFYGINLPYSSQNNAGSNGWVSYSIRTKNSLTPGTMINNRAGIYFDNNPVVLTNTTQNMIHIETYSPLITQSGNVYTIHPNPTRDRIEISFQSSVNNDRVDVAILSVDGKLMMQEKQIVSGKMIDLSQLPSGVYFCHLTAGTESKTIKLIKE